MSLHQGGQQIGFRPLANGTMFWLFVPVKSTGELKGAGGPGIGDGFTWLTDATGVYANPGRSFVWANVLPTGTGNNPFIYFARDPAVIPYWKENSAPDPVTQNSTQNRAEWFANLYSAGKTGNLCWELHEGATATGPLAASCNDVTWTSAIPNPAVCPAPCLADSWVVVGKDEALGPNGGYVPFSYNGFNETYTIHWTFTPITGPPVFKDATFTTLNGPDPDGDGIGLNDDGCPSAKGTLPNGCLPGVQPDPDKDGVYGAADLCPSLDGQGAPNGCPGGIIPNPPKPDPVSLVATLLTKSGTAFKRTSLAKGAPVKFECTVDSAAAGTLSITKKVATKLRIKTTKKQKTVGIASGKGLCKAAGGGSLKLKLVRAYAKRVKNAKKPFPASLAVKLTAAGQTPVTVKRPVKVR